MSQPQHPIPVVDFGAFSTDSFYLYIPLSLCIPRSSHPKWPVSCNIRFIDRFQFEFFGDAPDLTAVNEVFNDTTGPGFDDALNAALNSSTNGTDAADEYPDFNYVSLLDLSGSFALANNEEGSVSSRQLTHGRWHKCVHVVRRRPITGNKKSLRRKRRPPRKSCLQLR